MNFNFGKHSGFTLLEMLVAIAIFSIIAAISYASLNRLIDIREVIAERNIAARELQSFFTFIENDLRYAVNRPARNQYGEPEQPLLGGDGGIILDQDWLRLTTSRQDPELAQAQRLQRVSWKLEDGVLSRTVRRSLDATEYSADYGREMLSGVSNIDVEYYSYTPANTLKSEPRWSEDELPVAVELIVTLENGREYRRLFELAGDLATP